jgi:nitrogenase subunit NifH
MKVKRSYALDLNAVLANSVNNFEKPISGRFRYMVSNNLKVTGEERKAVIEAFPDSAMADEYRKLAKTLMKICKSEIRKC